MSVKTWKTNGFRIDIRYVDKDNQPQRFRAVVPARTRAEAEAANDAIEAYLVRGGPKPTIYINREVWAWERGPRPNRVGIYTIKDLADAYKEFVPRDLNRELRPLSLATEFNWIDRIVDGLGRVALTNPTEPINRFLLDIRGRLAPETQKHYIGAMRRMFAYGVEIGAVTANPVTTVRMPRSRQARIYPLTRAELQIFIAESRKISPYWADFFQFAAATGLRLGELSGLLGKDVSELRNVLRVERASDRKGRFCQTKSGRDRLVPLTPAALDVLERLGPIGPNQRIFRNQDGSHIRPSSFRKTFVKAVKAMERPHRLRFHDLRHTFATLALSAGIPVQRVSKWLGHSSVTITLRCYDGMTAMGDGVDADVVKLGAILGNEWATVGQHDAKSALIDATA